MYVCVFKFIAVEVQQSTSSKYLIRPFGVKIQKAAKKKCAHLNKAVKTCVLN